MADVKRHARTAAKGGCFAVKLARPSGFRYDCAPGGIVNDHLKKHSKSFVTVIRDHVSSAVVGGLILMLTGFTPEHLFVEAMHALHLSNDSLQRVLLGVDPRLLLVLAGVVIIVGDLVLRRRTAHPETTAGADKVQGDGPPAPREGRALALPDKTSIAVLPFQNLSGDPEQEYFADGMVEEIITGLARIKWLFVIARNSTFIYKGQAVDVKQAGRELGVRYLLEGSVRKAGERVRVTCQLIEGQTGAHLWAEHYDRSLRDIFALQDEVTLAIVGAIEPSLRVAEIDRVKRRRPENLDAYDLLLRAISADMAMPEGVAIALPFLERALELEPNYARAHGHLAMCYHVRYLRGGLRDEDRRAAIQHAHAAIANGQDDNTALTLAGFVIGMDEHDRIAASQAFETALALSPSSAFTFLIGSAVLGWGGDAERAIDWANRALRLSPFDSWNWFCCHGLALGHFSLNQYQEAAAAARKAIQFNPGFSMSHMLLAASLEKLGRSQEAKSAAARVLALQPSYRFGKHFAGVDCAPALAASLSEALRATGLPE